MNGYGGIFVCALDAARCYPRRKMRYIVVDLEATCWEGVRSPDTEIIEIGAVMLASSQGPTTSDFGAFVRPVVHPRLSDFCRELTSIRQEDVDGADPFPAVLRRLRTWIGTGAFTLCSWGGYDLNQLRNDSRRHGLQLPPTFERGHTNLKKEFARVFGVKSCGMARALEIAGLPLEGTHHRGADDARNIARLALLVLPRLEAEETARAFAGERTFSPG